MNSTLTRFSRVFALLPAAVLLLASTQVQAHFPWLAMSSDGKAEYFFGEDPSDRDYHLPDTIASTKVWEFTAEGGKPLAMQESDQKGYSGLLSKSPAKADALYAQTTYGVYRGSRLNYYTLHYGGKLSRNLKKHQKKFASLPLDLVAHIVQNKEGVTVHLMWKGKPLADTSVSLYSAKGEKQSSVKTGKQGQASFTVGELTPGLNGIIAGFTDKEEKGKFEGAAYEGASHYLTTTFVHKIKARPKSTTKGDSKKPEESAAAKAKVPVSKDSVSQDVAQLHKPLPSPLTSFGAAVVKDYLYVFSGHDGSAHGFGLDGLSNHFRRIRFDDPDAEWEDLAMHEGAQSTALVTDGTHLYRIGGLTFLNKSGEETNFKSTTHFARYDIAKNKWEELAPLPEPRSSLDAAILGRMIYVGGGWNLQGASSRSAPWHETIVRFNLDKPEDGWQVLPGPGYVTRAVSMAAYDGKIYLIGGIQQRGITRKVSVFDPKSGEWSEGPELLPDSRSAGFATSSFATGGRLYVTGGSGVLYRLGAKGKQWEHAGRLMFPRMFLRMLPVGENRLIALGGTSSPGGRNAAVESFRVDGKPQPKVVSWSVKFAGRAKHSQTLVLDGSKLFAFGGNASSAPHDFSKEAFVKQAFVFDIPGQKVEKLPDLPRAMQSGAGVALRQTSEHKKLAVAGGLGFGDKGLTSLNEIFTLDPQSGTWDTASVKLPAERGMHNAVYHQNAVWIFGGSGVKGGGLATDVLHWWGDSSDVTPLPGVKLPVPRRSAAGAVADGKYYVIGGLGEGTGIVADVDVFDFETREWTKASSPSMPRVFPSVATTGDTIYLAGGFGRKDGHFAAADTVEALDLKTGKWRTIGKVPGVTASMQVMNYGGRLLFYGIDREEDGVARFVLFDPEPAKAPEKAETLNFSGRSQRPDSSGSVMALIRRDTDKDGQLSAKELGAKLSALIREGDTDKNGLLSYKEIRVVVESKQDED